MSRWVKDKETLEIDTGSNSTMNIICGFRWLTGEQNRRYADGNLKRRRRRSALLRSLERESMAGYGSLWKFAGLRKRKQSRDRVERVF